MYCRPTFYLVLLDTIDKIFFHTVWHKEDLSNYLSLFYKWLVSLIHFLALSPRSYELHLQTHNINSAFSFYISWQACKEVCMYVCMCLYVNADGRSKSATDNQNFKICLQTKVDVNRTIFWTWMKRNNCRDTGHR